MSKSSPTVGQLVLSTVIAIQLTSAEGPQGQQHSVYAFKCIW